MFGFWRKTLVCLVCFTFGSVIAVGCGDNSSKSDGDASTGNNNQNSNARDGGEPDSLPFEECASHTEIAENTRGPADIIFVIDNSPSMRDEILFTQDNMNAFSQAVEDENLDLRIVLLGCLPDDCGNDQFWGICIDPPVGAGTCPLDESNPPDYLHINVRTPSTRGLERLIDNYDEWSTMLRDNTALHFVAISDDNEDWDATQFHDQLMSLDPSLDGYFFHGIFSYMSKEDACAISDTEPCCDYAAPEGEGTVYRDLVNATGGVMGDLCEQDFDPIFQQFASAVIESAKLNCEWVIPEPPEGETLDPALVNVQYIDGNGDSTNIGRVMSADGCSSVTHGWYYDEQDPPTRIYVCPQTCQWIQGDPGAQIKLVFGCETEYAPVM